MFAASEIFVGAGDIATCDPNAETTARLLDGIPGTVFTLGDQAYPRGAEAEYRICYDRRGGATVDAHARRPPTTSTNRGTRDRISTISAARRDRMGWATTASSWAPGWCYR